MNHKLRSLYKVIPILIEQKTWGGEYIVSSKGIENLGDMKIGQSYEISAENMLYVGNEKLFEVGSADSGDRAMYGHIEGELISLKNLIRQYPKQTLGGKSQEKYGNIFPLLVKLNQSLGNSFQLHIPYEKEDPKVAEFVLENPFASVSHAGGRLAKPESWYFLQMGYVSLGLRPGIDPKEFHQVCLDVQEKIHKISKRIQTGVTSYSAARSEIADFLIQNDPHSYVNLLHLQKGDVVDLVRGGIHHSWEDDGVPGGFGNIVYEIQLNRKDPISTIRAFDQGKLRPDGRYRKLNIDEYFDYLETDPTLNKPQTHLSQKEMLEEMPGITNYKVVSNQFYSLNRYDISSPFVLSNMKSFHHLYLHRGSVQIQSRDTKIFLKRGESAFIPFQTGSYEIIPESESTILCSSI